jgi:penicillin amidase
MKRIGRCFLKVSGITLATVLIVTLVLTGTVAWQVRRPWPRVKGTTDLPGLSAAVEISWQMEYSRRYHSGTLSEIFGQYAVSTDRFLRTVGLRWLAEQSWTGLDDDTRAILETYAEGVNAIIDTHRDCLPWEFTLLDIDPEPWTPVDSVAMSNFMVIHAGFNAEYELLRTWFTTWLGAETALTNEWPSRLSWAWGSGNRAVDGNHTTTGTSPEV